MKNLFKYTIVVAITFFGLLSSANAASHDADLLLGKMTNGKFYYDSTKPLYTDFNKCVRIYGGCTGVNACGRNVYYPSLDRIIKGHLQANYRNAVKVVTNSGHRCLWHNK